MQVGKKVLKALQKHARVTCGYAAVKVSLEHMVEIPEEQCCGTGTAGTATFCISGTGTGMHSGPQKCQYGIQT